MARAVPQKSEGCLRGCLARCRGFGWCALLVALLLWLISVLLRHCRKPPPSRADRGTQKVPSHVYRRPDPTIYDQYYLSSLGLAVTWDNPDIHLELPSAPGVHVNSHELQPGTEYRVFARVWNGSNYAPAPALPVRFSYLSFGAGTKKHLIDETKVNLPVKGAAGCPATATVSWTTPAQAGHYCLQVELIWADDQNPNNNLGQHNTDVKPLNSPRAAFTFALRNDEPRRRRMTLAVDTYAIPPLEPCKPRSQDDDPETRRRHARERHDPKHFPVPAGWQVNLDPQDVTLAPGQEVEANVEVIAPDGFEGRQVFNVNARDDHALLHGGVTLYAEGSADG